MVTVPTKTEVVTLRVVDGRKTVYAAAAAMEGARLSEWLRGLADRRVAEINRNARKRPVAEAPDGVAA